MRLEPDPGVMGSRDGPVSGDFGRLDVGMKLKAESQ